MGSVAARRIAVISAYCGESPEILRRCMASVAAQTLEATHFLVCDGPGFGWIEPGPRLRHVTLGVRHADFGDTPRGIGAATALREGFDTIAFLDADNVYVPDHLECLLHAADDAGVEVVAASRFLLRPDGSLLAPVARDGRHVDTSCNLLTGSAARFATLWLEIPKPLSVIGDRIFWMALVSRVARTVRVRKPTVGYTTLFANHYREAGAQPPVEGVKSIAPEVARARQWFRSLEEAERARLRSVFGFNFRL